MMVKKFFTALLVSALFCLGAKAQQLYNMSFDDWSKSSGAWNAYKADFPSSGRIWDTANHGLSLLGINGTVPEYEHVAVPGKGKAAAKIVSRKVVWEFVAGNLYTGRFDHIVRFKGAELFFGVPFTHRPKSMSGYCHYIPGIVNCAREPYLSMKGKKDFGRIEVILTDWKKPYRIVTCDEEFIDGATDPHVIGRAVLNLTEDTGGYIKFDIEFEYRSDATPSYAVITAASSELGAYFTGSSKSVLYIDEFKFNY